MDPGGQASTVPFLMNMQGDEDIGTWLPAPSPQRGCHYPQPGDSTPEETVTHPFEMVPPAPMGILLVERWDGPSSTLHSHDKEHRF